MDTYFYNINEHIYMAVVALDTNNKTVNEKYPNSSLHVSKILILAGMGSMEKEADCQMVAMLFINDLGKKEKKKKKKEEEVEKEIRKEGEQEKRE
jgi:hypothetical protein